MQSAKTSLPTCTFMAELVDLLSEPTTGCDKQHGGRMVERLDQLEADARQHGAREETLAAIKGARIVASLGEMSAAR